VGWHRWITSGWHQVIELIISASTETPGVDDRGCRADACRWPASSERGLGLVWMVSGMHSNLNGCDHVYEASRGGVWPQLDEAGE
jgi:hypothetical protein